MDKVRVIEVKESVLRTTTERLTGSEISSRIRKPA